MRPQTLNVDPDMLDCILLSMDDRLLITFFCLELLLLGSARYSSIHLTAALNQSKIIATKIGIVLFEQISKAKAKCVKRLYQVINLLWCILKVQNITGLFVKKFIIMGP